MRLVDLRGVLALLARSFVSGIHLENPEPNEQNRCTGMAAEIEECAKRKWTSLLQS